MPCGEIPYPIPFLEPMSCMLAQAGARCQPLRSRRRSDPTPGGHAGAVAPLTDLIRSVTAGMVPPAMNMQPGQVAFITGAASGIGRAAAQRLAAAGIRVAVADLNVDGARAVEQH